MSSPSLSGCFPIPQFSCRCIVLYNRPGNPVRVIFLCYISSRLLSLTEVLALSMMATNKCPKKKKGGCICPICEELIDDKLQQSIFCEGTCDSWLHRCCAGLSRAAFSKLEGFTEKFSCPSCRLHDQAIEISSLKESLASLQRDVAALQELQSMGNQSVVSSPEEPVSSNPRGLYHQQDNLLGLMGLTASST